MMKRPIYILGVVMAVLCSCAEDLGNYDYKELDELSISGLVDREVLMFDRLEFTPSFGVEGVDSVAYGFEWKAIDQNSPYEVTVLSQEKNLDYEVVLTPGSYTLYLTVTEKSTGLYWQSSSSLVVSSSMSEGWMVLCSENGRVRLDMVSKVTGQTYTDVLSSTGLPQWYGPRRIQWLSDKADESSPYYLLTDDGATRLGKDSFEWSEEYMFSYETAESADLRPHSIVTAGFGKIAVSEGKAYHCEAGMGIDGLYGSAVNSGFSVSEYVGANVLAKEVYAAVFLLYDNDNKRFMAYCPLLAFPDLGGLSPVQGMEDMAQIANGMAGDAGVVGTAFDTWPSGMDCLYMENTCYDPGNGKMGMTYAILSDGTSLHLYGIQLGDMLRIQDCTYIIGKGYYGDLSACTNIAAEGNLFAFSSLKSCLYYVSGETLYRVDLTRSPLQAEEQLKFPGEKVTCLKFNLYQKAENQQKSYDLIVCSEKNGEGRFRVYEGRESDGDFKNVTPVLYTGFETIVDIAYKERVY